MGEQGYGIDPKRVKDYAEQIKEIAQAGVEIAIVIGGGNIFRGLAGAAKGVDRVKRRPDGYAGYCHKLSCSLLCP